MSMHTTEYLHNNIRVGGVTGIVDGQGWRPPAWWFNGEIEKTLAQKSHYAESLPVGMIKSELFGWEALDGAVRISVELRIPADHPLSKTPGTEEIRQVSFTVPDYKGVVREDKLIECYLNDKLDELGPETVMNIASKNFNTDSFKKVLIDNVAEIVQESPGDLAITGAGLLKWGKVGYLEISVPRSLHNEKTGIEFRPNLLASSSFDGSVATRYDKTVTNVVCDNTHQWALRQSGEKTGSFKMKRTKNFSELVRSAREALGIMDRNTDEFTKIIEEWSEVPVSPKQFIKWMDFIVPVPELKTVQKEVTVSIQGEMQKQMVDKVNTNSQNIALSKRDSLSKMYYEDKRVAPWAGTKLGIAQLGNTWFTHESTMKGAKAHGGNKLQARVEGNTMRVLDGTIAAQDEKFINAIDEVLKNFDAEGVTIPLASDKPVTAARKRSAKQTAAAN
jgi:phage/plasmid-like protein (TIGR03299 family)